ncbi:type II toxin-antitoxin system RelE/ParE family toxin [Proteiniborus sp. MB09-C3]|uniref:type II toxin-antitoxin system RelE/ParE family toxin n=1 Tax=Proteiniborus sp. MB09-C3 TaxID=3050072 RepID=UPI0025528691|nr:type II toxin-antitoxin system RelE/ParE family toxin [Proteiniborus sp. MB09-C3]WIV11851.1 type II toxin-antitoxin system RelE/ParE family toxin [Proteiniborus sp. MB09-C3]
MYKVQYSPKAKEDLLRTKSYIRAEFSENLTKEILKRITTKIRNLEEFPLMGRPLANLIDVPTDYLYLVIEKNYVFYRNEEKTVKIIRVLNDRQDFMRILFGVVEIIDEVDEE